MKAKIRIHCERMGEVVGEITDEKNPKTARAVLDALPLELRVNRWGGEVYSSPSHVEVEEENSQVEMEVGDIAYWPSGRAVCIFFGPTPASRGAAPRAASGVNRIGRVLGEAEKLRSIKDGDVIHIELVE